MGVLRWTRKFGYLDEPLNRRWGGVLESTDWSLLEIVGGISLPFLGEEILRISRLSQVFLLSRTFLLFQDFPWIRFLRLGISF